jgi:hypothetical protein
MQVLVEIEADAYVGEDWPLAKYAANTAQGVQ